jgi:hypothetical protein
MNKKYLAVLAVCLATFTSTAGAEVGMGIRVSPFMGLGADIDIALSEKLNLRLGYNWAEVDYEVEDTDVTYDGEVEINSFSALLDWHAFGGGFRFTAGAVSSGPTITLDGTPAPGTTVEIGDDEYSAAEIGSLTGEIEIGDSIAPYFGIGYGNAARGKNRVTFLFDIGVIYTDSPNVSLTARCGPGIPTNTCNDIQQDVQAELAELEEDAKDFELYPVISLGIGIRF